MNDSPAIDTDTDSSPSPTPDSPFSSLSALYHLAVAIFTAARSALRCLTEHYQSRPHALTPDVRARLTYCANRLQAIFHTLCHAPARFLSAGQFRALSRAQAVLAHIWNQPASFDPLIPWLTAPENCPAPAKGDPAIGSVKSSAGFQPATSSPDSPLAPPPSALRTSPDPLLLQNPGRALAAVLSQLAAIYGVAAKPVAVPRPSPPTPKPNPTSATAPVSPAASPQSPAPAFGVAISPPSALRAPHFPHLPP